MFGEGRRETKSLGASDESLEDSKLMELDGFVSKIE